MAKHKKYNKGNKVNLSANGYGVQSQGAVKATGSRPDVNPFMLPKSMGLNVFTQAYPSNYYQKWDNATWRDACNAAKNQGYPIQYATLCKFTVEASAFVQGIMREITVAVENTPIFMTNKAGVKNEDLSNLVCKSRWFREFVKEIAMANFYGFSGLNVDFIGNKVYRYPMQNIDPINQFLRESTYDIYNGMHFDDNDNMFFVQPNTSDEFFLGWMQTITRLFIMSNDGLIFWNAYNRKTAIPIATAGYPNNDNRLDPNGSGDTVNNARAEAEDILANITPEKGIAYPYTIGDNGEIIKLIDIGFVESGSKSSQHGTFKEMIESLQNEIREMIMLSTLTSSVGARGSLALGEIHENKWENVKASLIEQIIYYLNDPYFMNKFRKFYKNIPKDAIFNINRAKQFKIPELEKLSAIMLNNGLSLDRAFFEEMGIAPEMIKDKPIQEPIEIEKPKPKNLGSFFFNKR